MKIEFTTLANLKFKTHRFFKNKSLTIYMSVKFFLFSENRLEDTTFNDKKLKEFQIEI